MASNRKQIVFARKFEKHYVSRIRRDKKLSKAFDARYRLFVVGERDYPLNDHPLTGNMAGKRAFSITADVRVVYEETEDEIVFLDVGTHNQVYE